MQRLYKYGFILLIVTTQLLVLQPSTKAQLTTYDKAQWIVNSIAPFTYWKNEVAVKDYSIGVYGSNDLYNELVELSKKRQLKNKPFSVLYFKKIKDIVPTSILYVSKSRIDELPEINEILAFNTLLITDEYTGKDFMLNFLANKGTEQQIDVLPNIAKKFGITFDDKLLSFAGKADVLRSLYTRTERQLNEEKKKIEEQRHEITSQTDELTKLKRDNKREREEIERQKSLNIKQRSEIDKQKLEIDQQRMKLSDVQKNLTVQSEKLNYNIRVLEHQQLKIKEQEDEVLKRNEEIRSQLEEIEKSKKDLKTKDIVLGQQLSQIAYQTIALIAFGVLTIFIIILAIYIWRNNQIKQRINEELRMKNIAINRQKEEISNQQKQTELLNIELEKLSIVAAQTDNAVTIMDRDAKFEWVNVGFTRMYGYTLQLLRNELDDNLRNASSNAEIDKILDQCINEKKTVVYESSIKSRSGKVFWVQTTLTPILNPEGEVSKLITIETDITRIKKAEAEIRKQHKKIVEQSNQLELTNKELEKLSLVASETENAISIMDAAGNFQWVNDGYSRLFGYTFSQLTNEYSRNIITKDISKEIQALIKKCIEDLVPVTYEIPWNTRDGREIWVQTTLTPITDKKGNPKLLIAISSDISKLKYAQQEIRQQSEELMAQKEELIIQKDFIEQQNQNIRSSISYAKTIQSAILPPESALNKDFESFIIYKPKDIVSGDFYWHSYQASTNGKPGKHFLAVVDCTGHGVPGAFMSMIGSQLLNEIVVEKGISSPSKILENMNKEIIDILKQEKGENNDGMDVCLCSIEQDKPGKAKVIYSGAKRPLYYYQQAEQRLNYIKGTRKTIGGTQARRNREIFMDHEIILNHGDLLYLSTDGIVDQPSPDRIRFGSLRFIDLLKRVGDKPINLQKDLVEKALLEYQQFEQQRDDVTFVGIKV